MPFTQSVFSFPSSRKRKTDEFLRDAVETRLRMLIPYIEHWPRVQSKARPRAAMSSDGNRQLLPLGALGAVRPQLTDLPGPGMLRHVAELGFRFRELTWSICVSVAGDVSGLGTGSHPEGGLGGPSGPAGLQ